MRSHYVPCYGHSESTFTLQFISRSIKSKKGFKNILIFIFWYARTIIYNFNKDIFFVILDINNNFFGIA